MEENLIERLYNPAGITEQELGDVALLLHDLLTKPNDELDYYDKRILISNIFRIVSIDSKLNNLVPTIEEISKSNSFEAYDASYLVEEILIAIRESSPNAYDKKDELLLNVLGAICNFKDNDYVTNPIRELLMNDYPVELINSSFDKILDMIYSTDTILYFRKDWILADIIKKKTANYPFVSQEEKIIDIGETIGSVAKREDYAPSREREAVIGSLIEKLPTETKEYSQKAICLLSAKMIETFSFMYYSEDNDELFVKFLERIPREAVSNNYDAILEAIANIEIKGDRQAVRMINGFLQYHEQGYENIPEDEAYRETLKAINAINKIEFAKDADRINLIVDRISNLPVLTALEHLEELISKIGTDNEDRIHSVQFQIQTLMRKASQELSALPKEEKLPLLNNILQVVKSLPIEDHRKGYTYDSVLDNIPGDDDNYISILNFLKEEVKPQYSYTLSSYMEKRMKALSDNPEKLLADSLQTIDFIMDLENYGDFERSMNIKELLDAVSPEVLYKNIGSYVKKLSFYSESKGLDISSIFNNMLENVCKSKDLALSEEDQIALFKTMIDTYAKSFSKKDFQFELNNSTLYSRMLDALPRETKINQLDDLASYVARSADLGDYSKPSIISDIYESSLPTGEDLEDAKKLEDTIKLIEHLLGSALLDGSIKQVVFEGIIDNSDPKLINANFDRIASLIDNLPVTGTTEKGTVTGLLWRKRLQTTFETEMLDPMPELKKAIETILSDSSLKDYEKYSALSNALKDLPNDMVKDNFYEIGYHILADKKFGEFYKVSLLGSIWENDVKEANNLPKAIEEILKIPEDNLSYFYKNRLAIKIWGATTESPSKYNYLRDYFMTLSQSKAARPNNHTKNFLELIDPIYVLTVERDYKALIEQIDGIELENFDKQEVYAKLILKLSDEKEALKAFKAYASAMQKAGNNPTYDFSSKEALYGSIALEAIKGDFKGNWLSLKPTEKKNILNGVLYVLSKDDPDVLDDVSLNYFVEAVSRGVIRVDSTLKTQIEAKYTELRKNLTPQGIDEYIAIIKAGKTIPEDKMDDFAKNVKLLKIRDGSIPKEIYDYVIRETIRGNIDKSKRPGLVMNATLSLCKDHLEEMGIPGYMITYTNLEPFTVGSHTSNYIRLSTDYFEKLSLSDMVNTIFHESRHAYQRRAIKDGIIDKKFYKMIKENIISTYDPAFYDRNYSNMENEFDARVYAALKTNEYLLSIGLTPKEIAEGAGKSLEEELLKDKMQDRSVKLGVKEDKRSIDDMVLEALNSNPLKITEIFSENPLLSVEYEVVSQSTDLGDVLSVRKKTKEEIEKAKQDLLDWAKTEEDKAKIEELFDYIQNGDKPLDHSKVTNGEYLRLNGYSTGTQVRRLDTKAPDKTDTIETVLAFARKCFEDHTAEERYSVQEELMELKKSEAEKESSDDELDK